MKKAYQKGKMKSTIRMILQMTQKLNQARGWTRVQEPQQIRVREPRCTNTGVPPINNEGENLAEETAPTSDLRDEQDKDENNIDTLLNNNYGTRSRENVYTLKNVDLPLNICIGLITNNESKQTRVKNWSRSYHLR